MIPIPEKRFDAMSDVEKLECLVEQRGNCSPYDCRKCPLGSGVECKNDAHSYRKAKARLKAWRRENQPFDETETVEEKPVNKFNVGDWVLRSPSGWAQVLSTTKGGACPVQVGVHTYTKEGFEFEGAAVPSIFTVEEAKVKFPEFPPPKKKRTITEIVFINVYPNNARSAHTTLQKADKFAAGESRLVCVPAEITYEVEE